MKSINSTIAATASNTPDRLNTLQNVVSALNDFLASSPTETAATVIKTNKTRVSAVAQALRAVNESMAVDYYHAADSVVDVMREASVPALAVEIVNDRFEIVPTTAHPTAHGLKDFVAADLCDRLDALRRCAAYVAMEGMDNRADVLTGSVKRDESGHVVTRKDGTPVMNDAPTKAAAAFIPENRAEISKNWLKAHLSGIITLLSDDKVAALVTSAMIKDFCAAMVRRSGWGVRTMSSQIHAGDCVLEYVHMLLSGKGKFTVMMK